MNPKQTFQSAYRAARLAARHNAMHDDYVSPLSTALDNTPYSNATMRYALCVAAESCALMHRSWRTRRNVPVQMRSPLFWRLSFASLA